MAHLFDATPPPWSEESPDQHLPYLPLKLYEVLEDANPQERAEYILQIINYERGFEVPKIEGRILILEGIDLSRETLEARSDRQDSFWWNREFRGIHLQGAQLEGAYLIHARLSGAMLVGADLKGAWLDEAKLQGAHMVSTQLQGASLNGAWLHDAEITDANLQGAQLRGANLHQVRGYQVSAQNDKPQNIVSLTVNLQEADLQGAHLQGAILTSAKLQGANLTGVELQGAHLEGAHFESTILGNRTLRPANLTNAIGTILTTNEFVEDFTPANDQKLWLVGAHMKGINIYNARFQDAQLGGADLSEARMRFIKLHRADLCYANLQQANLANAELQGADLSHADLQGATLTNTNLTGARLVNAKLQGVDLSTCTLTNVYFSNAWLDRTRLRQEQIGDATADEREARKSSDNPEHQVELYQAAERAYLALKQNFDGLGDYSAASWAYRRERRMRKQRTLYEAKTEHFPKATSKYLGFIGDVVTEWVCDYGESIGRVFGVIILTFIFFTVLYGIINGVRVDDPSQRITHEPQDLILFSLGAMSTLGAPGLKPACIGAQIAMPLQAIITVGLTGLLGFVAGNRIRRS